MLNSECGMTGKNEATVSHRDTEETEAAGQACLAQRGIYKKHLYLIYILVPFHTARLRP